MKYFVLGSGSWGTVISQILKWNGKEVLLWARREEVKNSINDYGINPNLPNVKISVKATTELMEGKDFDALIVSVPVQHIREVISKLPFHPKKILNLSKGIEISTGKLVSEIIYEHFPNIEYAVLSGPSHAEELIEKIPTAVVVAGQNAEEYQVDFSNDFFRIYTSNDVKGVEVCGALKNVLAIAAGILDGIGGWDNSKAALITRGIYEIARFVSYLGGNPLTAMGLAGIGDLVVTCNSKHSRNRRFGEMIAKGFSPVELLNASKEVIEGAYTCKAIIENYACKVDLPITQEVYRVIYEDKNPYVSIKDLMSRTLKNETEELKEWLKKNLKNS